jgi:hypothetical protein
MTNNERVLSKSTSEKPLIDEQFNSNITMSESYSASNFDQYVLDLHDQLDHLREHADVDEQSTAIVTDLVQAYSAHPSAMQTGKCIASVYSHCFHSCLVQSCVYQRYSLDKRIYLPIYDVPARKLK